MSHKKNYAKEQDIEKQGECPMCESTNLNYDKKLIRKYNNIGFKWVCDECFTQGTEWHTLLFSEHIVAE